MIRFLIDQFRQANGPFKKTRILAADLADELIDLAKATLLDAPQETSAQSVQPASSPCCANDSQAYDVAPTTPPPVAQPAPATMPETQKKRAAFETALEVPTNMKKQDFKILAILWDARQKGNEALSAKEISAYGEQFLNLKIRHENVRKVIRMRLENYVSVHAQGVGNGTVYKYEISDEGIAHFEKTYF